jgi:hypothetical protein
MFKELLQENS